MLYSFIDRYLFHCQTKRLYLLFAVWQHHLLKFLPVIICYETLHTHSKLWPMVWVSKRCVITQCKSHHSNWKEKKAKANTLCHIIVWLQSLKMRCGVVWVCELVLSLSLLGALLQCVTVVSWWTHAQMKCHAFSWRCHSDGWLYSLCCLFALGSWLLLHWLTLCAVPDNLYAFNKLKYSITAPLRLSLVHKSTAIRLPVSVTYECCLQSFN